MQSKPHDAVRQVLKEAAQTAKFFNLSDAERLNWMIERAYRLGCEFQTSALKRTAGIAVTGAATRRDGNHRRVGRRK